MSLYSKYYPDKFNCIGGENANKTSIKDIKSHLFNIEYISVLFNAETLICKICGIRAQIRGLDRSFSFIEGIWLVKGTTNCATKIMEIACK